MELAPKYYIVLCAALVAFQAAYTFAAARSLPAGARVPLSWGLFGRPTALASPALAFVRGPLWAAFAYGVLIAPMPVWGWPDVSDWYLAMTAGVALINNGAHMGYLFFARRHALREDEQSAFMRGVEAALRERGDQRDQ